MYRTCLEKLNKLKNRFEHLESYSKASEIECQAKLEEQERTLFNLQETVARLHKEKNEYKQRIAKLQMYIAKLKEHEDLIPNFTNISKAVFNCVTIGEIRRLRKLFQTKNFKEILKEKNVKVLQKICMGLNSGVIPVCNPQRSVITDVQRDIVQKLEDASSIKANKILKNNMELVANLFDSVDSSIKMIVDLYYQFGSSDEDRQLDSDLETVSEYPSENVSDDQQESDLETVSEFQRSDDEEKDSDLETVSEDRSDNEGTDSSDDL